MFKEHIRGFLNNLLLRLLQYLLCHMDHNMSRHLLHQLILQFEKKLSVYISYSETPKYAEMLNLSVFGVNADVKMAVIIQGPLILDNNYTLETVRYYKKIFPETKVIVSTWKDSDCDTIDEMKKLGAIIVLNEYPSYSGIYNINYQVVSTYNGLLKAKELGLDYCIKSRADQRICRPNIASYLFSLLRGFPLVDPIIQGQKERIVFCQGSHPAHMLIPYEICDFFFFGHVDDLLSFFHYELSNEKWERSDFESNLKEAIDKDIPAVSYHAKYAPEVLLFKNFLRRNGFDTDRGNAIDNYWTVVTNSFVPVSVDDIKLHWIKNVSSNNDSLFKNEYAEGAPTSVYNLTWSFSNWMAVKYGTMNLSHDIKDLSKQSLKESGLF